MNRRVRTGSVYRYDPVPLDIVDPPYGKPRPGDQLRVVNLPGCPRAGTMRMCHVQFAATGQFAGLVCINSLLSERQWTQVMAFKRR